MVWFLSGSALVMGIVSSNLFCLHICFWVGDNHICFWVGDNVYRGKERVRTWAIAVAA